MTPTPVWVDLLKVANAAAELGGVGEELRRKLVEIDKSVDGLAGPWTGDSSTEYRKVWDQWNTHLDESITGLLELSEWMAEAGKLYERATTPEA